MITDLTPYRHHLDEFDMTEEEKLELVNAIWVIAKNLLDKKFGINQPRQEQVNQWKKLDKMNDASNFPKGA